MPKCAVAVSETDQCHGDLLFFQSFRDQVPKCTNSKTRRLLKVDYIYQSFRDQVHKKRARGKRSSTRQSVRLEAQKRYGEMDSVDIHVDILWHVLMHTTCRVGADRLCGGVPISVRMAGIQGTYYMAGTGEVGPAQTWVGTGRHRQAQDVADSDGGCLISGRRADAVDEILMGHRPAGAGSGKRLAAWRLCTWAPGIPKSGLVWGVIVVSRVPLGRLESKSMKEFGASSAACRSTGNIFDPRCVWARPTCLDDVLPH